MLEERRKSTFALLQCDESVELPSFNDLKPIARELSGEHSTVLVFCCLLLGITQRRCAPVHIPVAFNSSNRPLHAFNVSIRSKLPSCVGLGSSGAYCVCLAAALLQHSGLIPPPPVQVRMGNFSSMKNLYQTGDDKTWKNAHLELIRTWATAAEEIIHGRASGIDAAVSTYGMVKTSIQHSSVILSAGSLSTFKQGSIQRLKNAPALKLLLVNSKVARDTSTMVAAVKEKHQKVYKDNTSNLRLSSTVSLSNHTDFRLHRRNQSGSQHAVDKE